MVQINKKTSKRFYIENIFTLKTGDVFKFSDDIEYETVLVRLSKYIKNTEYTTFQVTYCVPGSSLFALYGDNTIVVLSKTTGNTDIQEVPEIQQQDLYANLSCVQLLQTLTSSQIGCVISGATNSQLSAHLKTGQKNYIVTILQENQIQLLSALQLAMLSNTQLNQLVAVLGQQQIRLLSDNQLLMLSSTQLEFIWNLLDLEIGSSNFVS